MPSPRAVVTPMPEKLAAHRRAVEDARASLRLAERARNADIVRAIDEEGMSQREVGKLAGVTGPRVSAILAGSQDDDE